MSRGLPPIFKVYHVTPLWWELQRRHRCIDLACSKLDIGKRSMCQSHHCHVHPRFVSQGQVVSEFSQSWQTQKKISILVLENHGLLLQFSASWRGMDQCHEALESCSFQIQVQITKSHRCRNRLHWLSHFYSVFGDQLLVSKAESRRLLSTWEPPVGKLNWCTMQKKNLGSGPNRTSKPPASSMRSI